MTMSDNKSTLDWLQNNVHFGGAGHAAALKKDAEAEEVSAGAFGYLRGIKDRSYNVEFRFKDGNIMWLPYSLMGACRFDPSVGILLKFSGDLIYVVLIRGSNLDVPLDDGNMTLTSGLQRHRIVWVREMREADIKGIGETGPTIDNIWVAEIESHADLRDWLGKNAPGFVT